MMADNLIMIVAHDDDCLIIVGCCYDWLMIEGC